MRWCQMRFEVSPIYTSRWGSSDMSIGLHDPTWWYGRPWQFSHLRAWPQQHNFSYPNLMIFRSILVLSKRGTQCNNHFHQTSCLKWNLALLANFNTPSQLGRILPANPSIVMPSCRHVPSLHLISTLLNTNVTMKKNWLRVSHKTLPLSTNQS